MFEATILSFGIFTNNGKVNVLVSGWNAGKSLDVRKGGKNVQFLSQSNIQTLMTISSNWGEQDALESNLVSFQTVRCSLCQTRVRLVWVPTDIVLLPFNGQFCSLKDVLDALSEFSSNPIPGDQGDGVVPRVLGECVLRRSVLLAFNYIISVYWKNVGVISACHNLMH